MRLDGVVQPDRLGGGRDEAEPPARREAVRTETDDAARDRVDAMEVVQEPSVEIQGLEHRLDARQVDHAPNLSQVTRRLVRSRMDRRRGAGAP